MYDAVGTSRETEDRRAEFGCLPLAFSLTSVDVFVEPLDRKFGVDASDTTVSLDAHPVVTDVVGENVVVKRPSSDGGSGYWISTRGWSVRFVA